MHSTCMVGLLEGAALQSQLAVFLRLHSAKVLYVRLHVQLKVSLSGAA
jgi:hypothetical protein